MKKIFKVLLVLSILFSFSSCLTFKNYGNGKGNSQNARNAAPGQNK